MYIIIILLLIIVGLVIYIKPEYKQFEDKPIIYYHPIIRNKYCKMISMISDKPEMKTLMNHLIRENNILLEKCPYHNMDDRLNIIKNNRNIQTIFNLLDI